MQKHLRRWHFDLALFLGLALFFTAYWYSSPKPLWTRFYHNYANQSPRGFKFVGFSSDSQVFYTTCQNGNTNHVWPVPQIQRWSTLTGDLLSDAVIDIPIEDQFLYDLPRDHEGVSYDVMLLNKLPGFMVRYFQCRTPGHHYTRFYDTTGKPVWKGIETPVECRIGYLPHQSSPQQQLLDGFEYEREKGLATISLLELSTGRTLTKFPLISMFRICGIVDMPGGPPLLFLRKEDEDKVIEVINLKSGESIQSLPVPEGNYRHFKSMVGNQLVMVGMNGDARLPSACLHFYQYDPLTQSIKQDSAHPLEGLTATEHQAFNVTPPFLQIITERQLFEKNVPWIEKLLGWLARVGITLDVNMTQYRIIDLLTGKPLRQITGIPEGNNLFSPDMQFVINVNLRNSANEPGFTAYAVPHHLWETTLSWLQWLAWLFVLPWPLRYFIARRQTPLVPNATV